MRAFPATERDQRPWADAGVVGLTLESGEAGQAAGALLLFATNVAELLPRDTVDL